MSYPVFELLALTVGSISIVVAIVATSWSGVMLEEAIAQGLLLLVIVGAVHRGRKGGLFAAIFAILAYFLMRVPMLRRDGFSPDVVGLLLVRTATYTVIGIGGGALCARIHHFLARLESTSNIDVETQLFNERFIARTLRSMLAQYDRFQRAFSVVILSLSGVTETNPDRNGRDSLRTIATYLRDHVRLIDDVARLDDGRLLLVLPQTDKNGARIAADRLSSGAKRLLGSSFAVISVEILGATEDLNAIRELCRAPEPAESETELAQAT